MKQALRRLKMRLLVYSFISDQCQIRYAGLASIVLPFQTPTWIVANVHLTVLTDSNLKVWFATLFNSVVASAFVSLTPLVWFFYTLTVTAVPITTVASIGPSLQESANSTVTAPIAYMYKEFLIRHLRPCLPRQEWLNQTSWSVWYFGLWNWLVLCNAPEFNPTESMYWLHWLKQEYSCKGYHSLNQSKTGVKQLSKFQHYCAQVK